MTTLDPEAEAFLEKIVKGEMDSFSEEDEAFLLKHKLFFAEKNLAVLSEGMELLSNGRVFDGKSLELSLGMAAFFEDSQAFKYVRALCHAPAEIINHVLGYDFIDGELEGILAATAHDQWTQLKEEIEDSNLDEFIRGACLSALVIMGAMGKIRREEVVQYFRYLFDQLIKEQSYDEALAHRLVFACIEFWPGEFLEEIKELLGLRFVDSDYVDIEFVMEVLEEGEEACIEELKEAYKWQCSLGHVCMMAQEDDEPYLEDLEEADDYLDDPGRNDPCPCDSGRKYKKCCLNKDVVSFDSLNSYVNEEAISYERVETPDIMAMSEEERDLLAEIYDYFDENPERSLEISQQLIAKYPDSPALHNYLYISYAKLGKRHESIKALRETVRKFPDYLFGKVEYAAYFLRRGETEKIPDLFNGAKTLLELYPDRDVFHITEWRAFWYAMGCYFIQIDDVKEAKLYSQALKQMLPDSKEAKEIEKRIWSRAWKK